MTTHIINSLADLFDAAAEELEIHGWCTDRVRNEDGNLCVVGALRTAVYDDIHIVAVSYNPTYQDLISAAYSLFHTEFDVILPVWNDTICTGEQDAIDTLRLFAKKSRETSP